MTELRAPAPAPRDGTSGSAPHGATELPSDYHARIFEVEQRHWWHRGMRRLSAVLLGERLDRRGLALLDAGCGTGGFTEWLLSTGAIAEASGVDVSGDAIELARRRVPAADLRVAAVVDLPFAEDCFDLVVMNDVLQHIPEADVEASLRQIARVLRPGGALLVRTGGSRTARRERADWRTYDRPTLAGALEGAGLRPQRITYVSLVPSLVALARGRTPTAPTEVQHGIPAQDTRAAAAIAGASLAVEAAFLARTRRHIPYGHTLLGLAVQP